MSQTTQDNAHLRELAALISQSVETVLAEYAAAARPVPSLVSTDASATLVNGAIREAVCVLESACAQLCASVAPASHTMANRAFDMINPACLRVALTARTAEHLRDGPKPVSELAALAGMDADKLGRVLRNLATKHCFREVSKDVYANNKLSICLLPEDTTSGLIGHFVDEVYHGLGCLSDVLSDPEWASSTEKDKCAFVRAHGQSMFEMATNDPVRGARFPIAMAGWTKLNGGASVIAESYPWHTVPQDATFCDLGGSVGHVAMALTKAHPHIRAVVQDLPSVIGQAQKVWEQDAPEALQKGRVDLVAIDFLAEAPVDGCDFYYLKHVLHDWSDADCVTILRNVRKAMTKPHAKLLIHEIILLLASADGQQEGQKQAPFPLLPNFGVGAQRKYNQDLNMLSTCNGRERTLDEFITIGKEAGLQFVKTWDGGDTTMVEFEAV